MTPAELAQSLHAVLTGLVEQGALALAPEDLPREVAVERPRQREHGDWATNVALQLGKKAGMAPRDLAALVAARLADVPGVAARSPLFAFAATCSSYVR